MAGKKTNIPDQLLNLLAVEAISKGGHVVFACANGLRQSRGWLSLNFTGAQILDVKALPKDRSGAIYAMAG